MPLLFAFFFLSTSSATAQKMQKASIKKQAQIAKKLNAMMPVQGRTMSEKDLATVESILSNLDEKSYSFTAKTKSRFGKRTQILGMADLKQIDTGRLGDRGGSVACWSVFTINKSTTNSKVNAAKLQQLEAILMKY